MGKVKSRGDEHATRINYLFQAGQMMTNVAPVLSQYYGKVLTVITEKTAPKKDFTMKRSMCKKCNAVLAVGVNATYRLRRNKHKKGAPIVVIGCQMCGERKRLPSTRGYKLKAEMDGHVNTGSSSSRRITPEEMTSHTTQESGETQTPSDVKSSLDANVNDVTE